MNKNEFEMLLMLYAAGIDGKMQQDELETILERFDEATFKRVKKMYDDMSDMEIMDCIAKNKGRFTAERDEMIGAVHAILNADGRNLEMEKHLMRVLNRML